jgi:hypothetical protein
VVMWRGAEHKVERCGQRIVTAAALWEEKFRWHLLPLHNTCLAACSKRGRHSTVSQLLFVWSRQQRRVRDVPEGKPEKLRCGGDGGSFVGVYVLRAAFLWPFVAAQLHVAHPTVQQGCQHQVYSTWQVCLLFEGVSISLGPLEWGRGQLKPSGASHNTIHWPCLAWARLHKWHMQLVGGATLAVPPPCKALPAAEQCANIYAALCVLCQCDVLVGRLRMLHSMCMHGPRCTLFASACAVSTWHYQVVF